MAIPSPGNLISPDKRVRDEARDRFRELGAEALPALTKSLVIGLGKSAMDGYNTGAIVAGALAGASGAGVVSMAAFAGGADFEDPRARIRKAICRVLGDLGELAEPAIPDLQLVVSKSPDTRVRSSARQAIKKIKPKPKSADNKTAKAPKNSEKNDRLKKLGANLKRRKRPR